MRKYYISFLFLLVLVSFEGVYCAGSRAIEMAEDDAALEKLGSVIDRMAEDNWHPSMLGSHICNTNKDSRSEYIQQEKEYHSSINDAQRRKKDFGYVFGWHLKYVLPTFATFCLAAYLYKKKCRPCGFYGDWEHFKKVWVALNAAPQTEEDKEKVSEILRENKLLVSLMITGIIVGISTSAILIIYLHSAWKSKYLPGKLQKALIKDHNYNKWHLASLLGESELSDGETVETVNDADDRGYRPLHIAAMMNEEGLAEKLIQSGADVNLQDPNDEESPLHTAARYNAVDVAKKLLAQDDIKIDLKSSSMYKFLALTKQRTVELTPLQISVLAKAYGVTRELLSKGADKEATMHIPDHDGEYGLSDIFRRSLQSPEEERREDELGLDRARNLSSRSHFKGKNIIRTERIPLDDSCVSYKQQDSGYREKDKQEIKKEFEFFKRKFNERVKRRAKRK
jgi:hypothetical protein